ncbi:tRNA(Phe) wybutosine-synthesizing methylase Tyw3 [Virgibacillus natechei]|uniref:tRNA(Phe) wybutosine-synthesizing methylase Tyw3 n=2 Tax=Virgibacillus natechei TaxID=1216297 RepID=A0ABS4IM82_9BACI|nr:tRNA(Phe) wybutosine-synthesizing methylase Tyw3 [Virgibacillus natechei]
MSDQLLQQLVDEIKDIKVSMATKHDLESFATKDYIDQVETRLSEKIDRNSNQIVRNTEHLNDLSESRKRHDKILEILSLRSIEQEGALKS